MAGHEMFKLSLDVPQQAGGSEAEEVGLEPAVAELLLHEGQIGEGVLGLGDSARGFVADPETRLLMVLPDLADHGQAHGQGGVDAFLSGGSLDEVGPGHHADEGGPGDVPEGAQFARCEDGLDVGLSTGFAEGLHLVVEGLPVLGEHVAPGDDDIDLPGSRPHRFPDLGEAQRVGGQSCGEPGRDRGYRNIAPFQGLDRGRDHLMIDANGACGYRTRLEPEGLEDIRTNGEAGFPAKPPHAVAGVVPGERGQVDAGDGLDQPGRLVGLLDRSPPGQGLAPALDGRGVGLDREGPVEIQFGALVPAVFVVVVLGAHA